MVGIIVISESKAAAEMLKTVERVLGKDAIKGIKALVIRSDFSVRTLKAKINKLVKELQVGKGVIIMSELYGSTQSNVCKDFIDKGNIELICGYNLPMILKAAMINNGATLSEVATVLCSTGKKYIKCMK